MHRSILIATTAIVYYAVAIFGLTSFGSGMLVTAIVLFGVPAFVFAHFTQAPSPVIVSVAIFGAGTAVLLEAVAEIYGLWYTQGSDATRLFHLVPLEVVIAVALQAVFYALLYETLFDDGKYSGRKMYDRLIFFLTYAVGSFVLVALHAFVFTTTYLPYSFMWIVVSVLAVAGTVLVLHKVPTVHFFDRLLTFSLYAAVPAMINLWIAATNVQRVYEYTPGYLDTLNFFGQMVPVEAIVLAFALPLLVAVVYEIYLDDSF